MKKYCVGFLFDGQGHVGLILKQKPAWQKDRWNGIGGHIEEGESPLEAMRREFREETGAGVEDWHEFVCVKGQNYELHCFSAEKVVPLNQTTIERPEWLPLEYLRNYRLLDNLAWLIPMAGYKFKLRGEIWHDDPEC